MRPTRTHWSIYHTVTHVKQETNYFRKYHKINNTQTRLAVAMIRGKILGNGSFPLVAISQQSFLVVDELFVCLSRKFKVGTFDYSIDRACFLAESTIYAFCHIYIVTCGSTTAVFTLFGFDRNSLLLFCFLLEQTLIVEKSKT